MRIKNLLIGLFFISSISNAQEIVKELDNNISDVPKVYELKDTQWKAWVNIETEWKKEYSKILKEQKLKTSCKDCPAIYMDAVLSVDENGKLKYYKLVNSNKCSQEFSKGLEIRFMKWFFNYKFPEEFYNSKFEVRLGNGLKC
jgi:hypothetical protein